MADYTEFGANLDPDKPARSVDVKAIVENIVAVTEGAAGAPRHQTASYEDSSVTQEKLVASERMTTANVISTYLAGVGLGTVGSYMTLFCSSTSEFSPGGIISGSSLYWVDGGDYNSFITNTTDLVGISAQYMSGSWRYMGHAEIERNGSSGPIAGSSDPVGLFLRVA